ncbi:Vacuolar protein sorting-associated protein 35 [Tulasnella sp. JGI-2019a]|nr:Vacuolar protein sorting-associated protein 35 [Tulasnella sp. JGI-2019a]KAG9039127.1 Vacuolar protein sorting-associated protein 35 [Tulasnella sp. JGI-2019a]
MATAGPSPIDDARILSDAMGVVKVQLVAMRRHLEADQLMDALKAASTMLAELRTSSLSPKQYYELYMAVFDALRHISNYLYDAHTTGKHHLADLYELVQYAGNIVPRLYLMITVGSVYMSIPDAPIKEIMKDMMEMSRGVQHPTRGLFLRHYLSGQTRDHLPIGDDPGPLGNLQDSIGFVLTNFIEMNKLWVRLQHQGHSRDREKREMERRELRILVGTNLVRLSQLEGVDLDMYMRDILPSILEQIVNCKDMIAQEYLMEVVIQVFTDDFHLHTLGPFLSATAQLHPKVNIKGIVIALIDRLAAYAAREAENEDPEETKRQEEAAARRLAERVRQQKQRVKSAVNTDGSLQSPSFSANGDGWGSTAEHSEDAHADTSVPTTPSVDGAANGKGKEKEVLSLNVPKFRGIPENVKLFEVFWHQVVELIKARPDLSIQDITALLVSLANLSLSCYPDRLEYVDQVLGFAKDKVTEFADRPELHSAQTTSNLQSLLLAPINSYQSSLTLLALPRYNALLTLQNFSTRRAIAHAIIASIIKNETALETPEDVAGILEMAHVLVRDQGGLGAGAGTGGRTSQSGPVPPYNLAMGRPMGPGGIDMEELAEEQGWVARMVHLFKADTLDMQFELIQTARRYFADGGDRMRFTYPPLITSAIKLARRYHGREHLEVDWSQKLQSLFRFIHQTISVLANKADASSEICLRLHLLAAQVCGESGREFEELTYEFYVQAFSVYEESIPESRAQLHAITTIIGTLHGARVFGVDNYDTLITKAALHSAKLLKKPHQATAVLSASHLWWQNEWPEETTESTEAVGAAGAAEAEVRKPLRDGQRVLECLQKSLRIASSSIEEIVSVQLYCDALDHYIYYYERQVKEVTAKYVNSLVELITSNIDIATSGELPPSARAPPGLVEGVHTGDMITRHFRNTLTYLRDKKETAPSEGAENAVDWDSIDIIGALLKMGIPAR